MTPSSDAATRRVAHDVAHDVARGPRADDETGSPPVLDLDRWYYRHGYIAAIHRLARYHRTRVEGTPPVGPCIYVAHHGAGYLSLDLAVAVYYLGWRDWFERGGAARPIRIVGSEGHALERAIPGLARAKRDVGMIGASQGACLAILARGEQLLVTPGGRRESTPAARGYRLRWADRAGFVRLALLTGAPIVPLAVVGGFAAYPGTARGKLSLWSPLPLPARLDIALGAPFAVDRAPELVRDRDAVGTIQRAVWDATQALYDRLLARRVAAPVRHAS